MPGNEFVAAHPSGKSEFAARMGHPASSEIV